MTEKRFACEVIDTDLWHIEKITDNFEMNIFDDVETVTELLNKFSEENEELKKRLSHAEKVNTGLIEENHRLRLTLIHSSDLNFDINWLKENLKDWNNE